MRKSSCLRCSYISNLGLADSGRTLPQAESSYAYRYFDSRLQHPSSIPDITVNAFPGLVDTPLTRYEKRLSESMAETGGDSAKTSE